MGTFPKSLGMSGFYGQGGGVEAEVTRDPVPPASHSLSISPVGADFIPALQLGKLRCGLGHVDDD